MTTQSVPSVPQKSKYAAMTIAAPLIFFLGCLVFGYAKFFLYASPQRVLRDGMAAEAHVVDLAEKISKGSEGREYRIRLAHLSWTDAQGVPKEFKDLMVGAEAYAVLSAIKGQQGATTPIKYDPTGENTEPFLMADLDNRKFNWLIADLFFWGFLIATLISGVYYSVARRETTPAA